MTYPDFCLLKKGDIICVNSPGYLSENALIRVLHDSNFPGVGIVGLEFELIKGSINPIVSPYFQDIQKILFSYTQLNQITKVEQMVCI